MKCPNCSSDIKSGDNFCTSCGNQISSSVNITPSDDKKANQLCILSLVLFYGSSLVSGIISRIVNDNIVGKSIVVSIAGLSVMASIILLIYVRVKYPENKFGKILMWISIVEAIIGLIIAALIFMACYSFLRGCSGF